MLLHIVAAVVRRLRTAAAAARCGQKRRSETDSHPSQSHACIGRMLLVTHHHARCREVQAVVEGPAQQLQEAVAQEISDRLLAMDPRVAAVRVYMRKPHVALPGALESVGEKLARELGIGGGSGGGGGATSATPFEVLVNMCVQPSLHHPCLCACRGGVATAAASALTVNVVSGACCYSAVNGVQFWCFG